ncbi:beta-eudesmol synthase-like [Zingiber officinale]|nr:beta-eudesmol synthase-like [Zingiber officinale]
MGLVATKEAFEWVASFPKIIKASSMICRLMDDLNPSELEQERDLAASTIECFMKEYGMDEKETYKKLMDMLEDAWKDHNNEYLNSTLVPRLLIERAMNFSRAMEEFYKYTDTYTNSKARMKDNISMVLVESVLI